VNIFQREKRVIKQGRFTRNWKVIEGNYTNGLCQTIPNIVVGKRDNIKIND
jgi:hypothetical protein